MLQLKSFKAVPFIVTQNTSAGEVLMRFFTGFSLCPFELKPKWKKEVKKVSGKSKVDCASGGHSTGVGSLVVIGLLEQRGLLLHLI